MQNYIQRFQELAPANPFHLLEHGVDNPAAFDLHMALFDAQLEYFKLTEWNRFTNSPLLYIIPLDISPFIRRSAIPAAERLIAAGNYLKNIQIFVESAIETLSQPIPQSLAEQSNTLINSQIQFHQQELAQFSASVKYLDVAARFRKSSEATITAFQFLRNHIQKLSTGTERYTAYGNDIFGKMLLSADMISTTTSALLQLLRNDMEMNHERLRASADRMKMSPAAALKQLAKRKPAPEHALSYIEEMIQNLHTFLRRHPVVTVPDTLYCAVYATKPYMRNGSAFLDAPGPFEEQQLRARLFITLPESEWPAEKQNAWMEKLSIYGMINTAAHEIWPGHYLQFQRLKTAPTAAAKIFTSQTFIEGWAHYAEEMIIDQGYGKNDFGYGLQQAQMALLRDCRAIIALQAAENAITLDEAANLIMQETFLPEIRARHEASRSMKDPLVYSYSVGKIFMKQFLAALRNQRPEWDAQRLHDSALSFGAPPIPLLMQALAADPPQ